MADDAFAHVDKPLPLYLSLAGFHGGDRAALIDLIAHANGTDPDRLDQEWRAERRGYCLLLDAADECDAVEDLVATVETLASPSSRHSIVVACRPGSALTQLRRSGAGLHELALLAPNSTQIEETPDAVRRGVAARCGTAHRPRVVSPFPTSLQRLRGEHTNWILKPLRGRRRHLPLPR